MLYFVRTWTLTSRESEGSCESMNGLAQIRQGAKAQEATLCLLCDLGNFAPSQETVLCFSCFAFLLVDKASALWDHGGNFVTPQSVSLGPRRLLWSPRLGM